MNYLEREIDSALEEQKLNNEKFKDSELPDLISKLIENFFSGKKQSLDPCNLIKKESKHDPIFWKSVDTIKYFEEPIIIVQDKKNHAWKLSSLEDLKKLLSETTGFPFWITDKNYKTLIYMDDHDCVHTSHKIA